MSAPPLDAGARAREHVRVALREVSAAIAGGALGAIAFLVMVQGSLNQGHTDLNFNHALGEMIVGDSEVTTGRGDALSVVGDTVAPAGLYAAIGFGIALTAVLGVVTGLWRRRHWTISGTALGAVTFLLIGLVFCPLADSRLDLGLGLFGADAPGITPTVLGLSSLGFGLVAARCHTLMVGARWWEEKQLGITAGIADVPGLVPDDSLELPEEGPEKSRVGY